MTPNYKLGGISGVLLSICLSAIATAAETAQRASDDAVWASAPPWWNGNFEPFPSIFYENGSRIGVENIRGTRLYGYQDCGELQKEKIDEAFKDFNTLVNADGVKKMDWRQPAAIAFWGPNEGDFKVTDKNRRLIQESYTQAGEMWAYRWGWNPFRYNWINVRCSSQRTDPKNICGERGLPGQCPIGRTFAFANNWKRNGFDYDRITFCKQFFQQNSLSRVTSINQRRDAVYRNDIRNWFNRATIFLHEVTHLEWFMNLPKEPNFPHIYDLKFKIDLPTKPGDPNSPKREETVVAIGHLAPRLLRNYFEPHMIGFGGFFTRANADTYAYYATAMYARSQIPSRDYPSDPVPYHGGPKENPVVDNDASSRLKGEPLPATGSGSAANATAKGDEYLIGNLTFDKTALPHPSPGCFDDYSTTSIDSDAPDVIGGTKPTPPKCDTKTLSGVPYNIFSGNSGSVYGNFCQAVGKNVKGALKWNTDATGKQKTGKKVKRRSGPPNMRIRKRTPPPNPDTYSDYDFELEWKPASSFKAWRCNKSCEEAYYEIAQSQCGHQGGEQNGMTSSGSLDVNCGTYSFKITPPAGKKPTTTAKGTTPTKPTSTDKAFDCSHCGTAFDPLECQTKCKK